MIMERRATDQEIRQRAYELYLRRGEQPGGERDDWFEAERELRAGSVDSLTSIADEGGIGELDPNNELEGIHIHALREKNGEIGKTGKDGGRGNSNTRRARTG
jgi:hypothetical protein